MIDYNKCADVMQDDFSRNYWDQNRCFFFQYRKAGNEPEKIVYWWHAHVIDVLLDAYERTKNDYYLKRIKQIISYLENWNNGSLIYNWYDDMEWMALALLRCWDMAEDNYYLSRCSELWQDIKTGWNRTCGGGIAWRKNQLFYKNTPANAPAAILAFRLYQRFANPDDLVWGTKILSWNKENLVDPATGFVWDGMNRMNDGEIDIDWEFTYCQGVYIGANIELYNITANKSYLEEAKKSALAAKNRFIKTKDGVIDDEGDDDCGLFRGIFIRYLALLGKICLEETWIKECIMINADTLWGRGIDRKKGLWGGNWRTPVDKPAELSSVLSGLMVIEAAVKMNE